MKFSHKVLSHLISNSVKFTNEGQIKIEIKSYGDNYMQINIDDTGCGLTEIEKSNLKESLSKISRKLKRKI